MFAIADTEKLVSDRIIDANQAREIESRARDTMVTLAINTVLCFGILSATGGLIFWLGTPFSVAIGGILFMGAGLLILNRGKDILRMFGNAATLIGAGMMLGGSSIELLDKYEEIAGPVMMVVGAIVALFTGYRFATGKNATARFVTGAIILMGAAMHLAGCFTFAEQNDLTGFPIALLYLYTAAATAFAGWFVNNRFITALAIVPFAQALETGTFYLHAIYAFYSPESTLTILQMTALIFAALWFARNSEERTARHARITSVMAFIVANLSALVGSLFGDKIGETLWGPGTSNWSQNFESYEAWQSARTAFAENAWVISDQWYSILWAIALLAIILFAAHKNNRGMFNTAMTFAGIHAYTQMFESFADEPLAWVIGGLGAIGIAWGMWRLNVWFANRSQIR